MIILAELFLFVSGFTGPRLSAAPATELLARVHWLGIKQISADTNSAGFMSVWRLPQTVSLLSQTLDKFSRWPGNGATNTASALLRPLLDDLVSSESYLELRAPANPQTSAINHQLLLALRLPGDRARLWQTNLAAASESLTGVRPVSTAGGWVLRQSHPPDRIEFSRVGDWTLVGMGQDADDLLSEFAARITPDRAPSATNFWLEADLEPPRLTPCISTLNTQLSTLNQLSFTLTGDTGNILTRGTFNFSQPLGLTLSAWEIPTNYIHQPLSSFTAMRGLAPWLAAMPAWQKLQLTPPPDQAFVWALPDNPMQTYFAAPLPAASNQLYRLSGRLVQNANPWLANYGESYFQWQTNPPSIVWNGALLFSAFLKPVVVNQQDYALGGLVPFEEGNPNPMPADFLRAILVTTNLVYYQAEQTRIRVDADLFTIQLFRLVFQKPQLPPKAAATVWLKNIEPLLGGSTTIMTQTGPEQLAFTRQSTIGLTALELHLLADWLESPRFPHGLHTFLAPPDK